jgi:hypothetical protein
MNADKLFYRVGAPTEEGLWYNKRGEFTGLIHTEFNWCNVSKLQMPFNEQLVGYLSVADSLEHLYQWFSKEELLRLQKLGFNIYEYKAVDFKFYDMYKHNVINQESSTINNIILLR